MILLALAACGGGAAEGPPDARRVIAIGPAVAEVAHRLRPDELVAVDRSSRSLPGLGELPEVGFSREIHPEGLLSLAPSLVLADESAGPPEAFEILERAGVQVVHVPHARTRTGVATLIHAVGTALEADPSQVLASFEASCATLPEPSSTRALFVYARGAGAMNVSGTGTAAAGMLELAGLQNAVTAYEGYRPLTPEAVVAADPDVLVFTTTGLEAAGGLSGLLTVPGLSVTDAAREGRVLVLDDLQLLAFGTDTCEAARNLAARRTEQGW